MRACGGGGESDIVVNLTRNVFYLLISLPCFLTHGLSAGLRVPHQSRVLLVRLAESGCGIHSGIVGAGVSDSMLHGVQSFGSARLLGSVE